MSDLSFWVIHGGAIWQIALALSMVAGFVVTHLLVDRAMRARAARVRETIGAPRPALRPDDAGKHVTYTGTIVAVGKDAKDAPPGAGLVATVSPQGVELSEEPTQKALTGALAGARLAIEIGDEKLTLDGPPQVLVGSKETERCVSGEAGRILLWDFASQLGTLPKRPFGIRTLSVGDKVRVSGLLRHEPDDAHTQDYRSARGAYFLEVASEEADGKFVPIAYEGRPRPLARKRGRTALRALTVPLGFAAVLGGLGEIAIRVNRPTSAAIAAATPFRRADALGQLRAQMNLQEHADAKLVARAAHLDTVRGRCGDASDDWFEHGKIRTSIEVAERCKDESRAGRGYAALAELEQAAQAFERARTTDPRLPPSLTEATAYLAASKSDRAANTLRALAASWEGPVGTRERFECIANAVEARAGKSQSLDALRAASERSERSGDNTSCVLLFADLSHGAERTALLSRYRYSYRREGMLTATPVADALELEDGITGLIERDYGSNGGNDGLYLSPVALVTNPRAGVFNVPPALSEAARRTLEKGTKPTEALLRARYDLLLSLLDSYIGETDDAKKHLDAAELYLEKALPIAEAEAKEMQLARQRAYDSPDAEPYPYWRASAIERASSAMRQRKDELGAFKLALAVRARDPGAKDKLAGTLREDTRGGYDYRGMSLMASHELTPFIDARMNGERRGIEILANGDTRDVNRKLWDLLLAEDADGLAARLRARGLDGRGVIEAAGGLAPKSNELGKWLRWSYPPACTTCGAYPLMNHTASRRDAAIALGDTEVTNESRDIALRLRALLLRRDIAIPLAVLSEMSPP
ncbi:MAG: hypothetical protein JWM74_5526 [Myxococcaceae bacterium]|nr:hypothetical protein [Myxococcaceae bacterium]